MSFLNSFFIKVCYKYVGHDKFGNKYYQSKKLDYLGDNRRYVVYKGTCEPSKVPPIWHAWLHHTSDELPNEQNAYAWQIDHIPNLTGTKFAYKPKNSKKLDTNEGVWHPKL
jgi:NADH:ubiquinone oxidoreductase subunit